MLVRRIQAAEHRRNQTIEQEVSTVTKPMADKTEETEKTVFSVLSVASCEFLGLGNRRIPERNGAIPTVEQEGREDREDSVGSLPDLSGLLVSKFWLVAAR